MNRADEHLAFRRRVTKRAFLAGFAAGRKSVGDPSLARQSRHAVMRYLSHVGLLPSIMRPASRPPDSGRS